MTCLANGTGIYEVGVGGSCELSGAVTGKATPLGVYYCAGGLVLYIGVKKLQARRNARQAQEQQEAGQMTPPLGGGQAAQLSLTAVQKDALFGEQQPGSSRGSGGWREKLESRQLMWLWVGVAILCDNVGQTLLQNLQANTLSLEESNAIDDADSVITVVQDVFSFFEDGMTVLIGAAVGAGDTASAGTLTTLGFIGGTLSGVVGAGAGTAAALTPVIMHAVVPASGGGECGNGVISSQAELERLALPYWLIAVWSWGFKFCNSVGTGVVLGTNATFSYAMATALKRLAAMVCFLLLAEALGHTAAVALADLLGSVAYFAVITRTIFVHERVRSLVPRPSWAEFWTPQTAEWAKVAGRAGAAMMVNMLVGQAQGTASTQLLARMGKGGLQYRAKLFGTITNNFWMPTALGCTCCNPSRVVCGACPASTRSHSSASDRLPLSHLPVSRRGSHTIWRRFVFAADVVRLTGSKFWGARMYPAFRYIAKMCVNGTLLLCGVALLVGAAFHASAPYSFASSSICRLLESVCTAPVFEEVYHGGGNFELTYILGLVLPQVGNVLDVLKACLFAAQDFDFVRNTSLVGLVCFVPLATVGYRTDSFVLLQLAPVVGGVLVCLLSVWRMQLLLKRTQGGGEPEDAVSARLSQTRSSDARQALLPHADAEMGK
jgi:hypothetical protein